MLKKTFTILIILGLLLGGIALAEDMKDEDYADLADSGLQIWISPSLRATERDNEEDALYAFAMPDGSGRLLIRHYASENSLDALYNYLIENQAGVISYGITEFDGVPFVIWRAAAEGESIYRAYGMYIADKKYALDIVFQDMDDAGFAETAEKMMASIRRKPEASTEVQWQTVGEQTLKQDEVYTCGDYTYTLNKYEKVIIRSVPATDTPGILLIPPMLDGYEVDYLEASCIPEDIHEVLMPRQSAIQGTAYLTHEIIEYAYRDYEYIKDWHEELSPYVFMGPDDLLLTGIPYRYAAGGKREKLVQDYYLYPTSVSGKKIWSEISHSYITLYTSGPYTYYKRSPETIGICAYSDKDAKKVTIPESVDGLTVTALGGLQDYATAVAVVNATEINLPSTLKVMGKNAVYSSKLKTLKLPEGLEEIGDCAIEVWSIKKLTLPSTLRRLGTRFMHTAVSSLVIPDGVTQISPHALDDLFLKSLTLPAGLTEIPATLCKKQQSLTAITIPAGVTAIGNEAFRDCLKLKTVKVEKGSALKTIGVSAFTDCKVLSKIEFPEGLEKIGDQAFFGCKTLNKLVMPSTLRTIGSSAFGGCKGLKQITLGAGVEEIDDDAFTDGAKKLTIIAPEGSYAAGFAEKSGYTFKPAK